MYTSEKLIGIFYIYMYIFFKYFNVKNIANYLLKTWPQDGHRARIVLGKPITGRAVSFFSRYDPVQVCIGA